MARLKFIAPLVMAGAAATAIFAALVAAAESYAEAAGISSVTIPASPGGDGCYNAICGSGDASGGGGCTADATCGSGGPLGGGCTADGVCGHGGPWGGGGCVPGVGCFNWGQ